MNETVIKTYAPMKIGKPAANSPFENYMDPDSDPLFPENLLIIKKMILMMG